MSRAPMENTGYVLCSRSYGATRRTDASFEFVMSEQPAIRALRSSTALWKLSTYSTYPRTCSLGCSISLL